MAMPSICYIYTYKYMFINIFCLFITFGLSLLIISCIISFSKKNDEWRPTASTHCPLSLSHKKLQEWGCSYTQNEAQKAHPQRISWLLVAFWTQHLLRYGARLFEERRRWTILHDFRLFQVCHFKIVTIAITTLLLLLQTGAGSISCLMYVLLDASICSCDIAVKTLIH